MRSLRAPVGYLRPIQLHACFKAYRLATCYVRVLPSGMIRDGGMLRKGKKVEIKLIMGRGVDVRYFLTGWQLWSRWATHHASGSVAGSSCECYLLMYLLEGSSLLKLVVHT